MRPLIPTWIPIQYTPTRKWQFMEVTVEPASFAVAHDLLIPYVAWYVVCCAGG